jgi:hypothetical protein
VPVAGARDSRKLETGNWKLETRNAKLENRNSKFVTSFQFLVSSFCSYKDFLNSLSRRTSSRFTTNNTAGAR